MGLLHRVNHLAFRRVVLLTLQSLSCWFTADWCHLLCSCLECSFMSLCDPLCWLEWVFLCSPVSVRVAQFSPKTKHFFLIIKKRKKTLNSSGANSDGHTTYFKKTKILDHLVQDQWSQQILCFSFTTSWIMTSFSKYCGSSERAGIWNYESTLGFAEACRKAGAQLGRLTHVGIYTYTYF
jgi:hypothetical protein